MGSSVAGPTLAVVLALVLVGCGGIADEVAEEAAERVVGSDVEIDTDDGSVTVESDQGTVAIGTGGDLPDGLPDQLPLPDGLEVLASLSQSTNGTETIGFQAATSSSYDDVVAVYEDGLADAWTVTDRTTSDVGGLRSSTWSVEGNGFEGVIIVLELGGTDAEPDVRLNVTLEGVD
jgi:hypothetical protein